MPDQDLAGFSRVCPSCGRRVPRNVATCRCGVALPAERFAADSGGGSRGPRRWIAGLRGDCPDRDPGRRRLLDVHAPGAASRRTPRTGPPTNLNRRPPAAPARPCHLRRARGTPRPGRTTRPAPAGGSQRPGGCARQPSPDPAIRIDRGNGRSRHAGGGADRNHRRARQRLLRAPRHLDHQRARRAERWLRHAAADGRLDASPRASKPGRRRSISRFSRCRRHRRRRQ